MSAFTDWMNHEDKFVKLHIPRTTVFSETVPELKLTTTSFPDNSPFTLADKWHLSTIPEESDNKNEEVM